MIVDNECVECEINYFSEKCCSCWRTVEYERNMYYFETIMEGVEWE